MRLHQRIRRGKLQGEQLDISFPRRGRPSRFRRLERAGQLKLSFGAGCVRLLAARGTTTPAPIGEHEHDVKAAADYLFPVGPMTDDQLAAEFNRLFPIE